MTKSDYTTANILESFKFALNGIKTAINSERNLKIHLSITILVIFIGFNLSISSTDWLFVTIAIFLVWICELINTSFENLADLISKKYNNLIKQCKDICAGATLLSVFNAIIIGYIIFAEKIYNEYLISIKNYIILSIGG